MNYVRIEIVYAKRQTGVHFVPDMQLAGAAADWSIPTRNSTNEQFRGVPRSEERHSAAAAAATGEWHDNRCRRIPAYSAKWLLDVYYNAADILIDNNTYLCLRHDCPKTRYFCSVIRR